jgi:hypothetical protein
MGLNPFSWVLYPSKSLQDFFDDFSELRAIFRGLKGNYGYYVIILIPKSINSKNNKISRVSKNYKP